MLSFLLTFSILSISKYKYMEQKIYDILINSGLNQKEVKIYLSMLINDNTTILRIADDTGIKRSTVYLAIKKLIEKNLARVAVIGKKKYFFAENPKIILEMMDKRKHQVEEILPILKVQYQTHREKPKITFYEGKDMVKKIYNDLLDSKTEIFWYGDSMLDEFKEDYEKFMKAHEEDPRENKLKVRDLVNPMRKEILFAKDRNKQGIIKAKVLPKHLLFHNIDNIIYENKLIILSIKQDYFAIIIESADIVNAYKCMFELAWKSAHIP